ncbi:MAG: GNAT family N-acetyltransferase, partial [Azoarcus sp.]|nr:GNAT family N-acetyltransferase [Azoarcus sp.]
AAAHVVVEPATEADIPALIGLLDILFSIEQDFHPDADKQRRALELLLARPQAACVMVARCAGEAVGMASAQLVVSTASGAPSAWIEDVVLKPEFRARGLGRELLEALADWAISRGAVRVQLLADADNAPALDFYRHLAWQPTRLFAWRKCW